MTLYFVAWASVDQDGLIAMPMGCISMVDSTVYTARESHLQTLECELVVNEAPSLASVE